jgi:hypothetical protein
MLYRDQDNQRLALFATLKELNERGVTDQALANAIYESKKSDRIPEFGEHHKATVSRATINRYRLSTDPYLRAGNRMQIALLYNFLATTPDFISSLSGGGARVTSAHELAPLLQALQDHVGQTRGELVSDDLQSLVGTYMVYRSAWTSPGSDLYISSVMTFEWVGNGLFYTDVQDYLDPATTHRLDEIDTGVALPFGMNIVLLARGHNHKVLKFSSIYDLYHFPNGLQKVIRFSGNAMAISGKGPHPGFPFAALRVTEPDQAVSRIFDRSELPNRIYETLHKATRRG